MKSVSLVASPKMDLGGEINDDVIKREKQEMKQVCAEKNNEYILNLLTLPCLYDIRVEKS